MKKSIKIILIFLLMTPTLPLKAQQKMGLVIHGGAGNIKKEHMSPQQEKAYREKLEEALQEGWAILEKGGSSLDAVTAAILILENSSLFNAGKGAVLNKEGNIELDASIMEGSSGLAGAVAGVSSIKNPILLARAVMEHSVHVMLSSEGAEKFAKGQELETVDPSYFSNKKRRLDQLREEGNNKKEEQGQKFGTVGAVALDKYGNLSAGTSTGGMSNKQFGRIGDSPIIGAGTYANNQTCAVSATGHGEFFIRNVVAYDISALMEYKNLSVKEAAKLVIMNKLQKKGGEGGVIAISHNGQIAMPFNTAGMFRGYIKESNKPKTWIFKSPDTK